MKAPAAQARPPPALGRAEAIARHTSLRGSGRVGRSAAGRALDEQAITLAAWLREQLNLPSGLAD